MDTGTKFSYIFFDRDGTLISHKHHLTRIQEVELMPDLDNTLLKLQEYGFRFIIVTNQSVISRGLASHNDVDDINAFIADSLKTMGIEFDHILVCPHRPEDLCNCRKPKIGLIENLEIRSTVDFARSYIVGDSETDILFGRNLGMRTILIAKEVPPTTLADFVVSSLNELPNIVNKCSSDDKIAK